MGGTTTADYPRLVSCPAGRQRRWETEKKHLERLRSVDSLRVAVLAALNLAGELSQAGQSPSGVAARVGHARAASMRVLLGEVLDDERKTG